MCTFVQKKAALAAKKEKKSELSHGDMRLQ